MATRGSVSGPPLGSIVEPTPRLTERFLAKILLVDSSMGMFYIIKLHVFRH